MLTLNLLFLAALITTFFLMKHEIRHYTSARLNGPVVDITRQRFTRRMFGVTIVTIVLAMTYFGYLNREGFIGRPWFFGIYWIAVLMLALLLIVVALIDIRATFNQAVKSYLNEGDEAERLQTFLQKEPPAVSNSSPPTKTPEIR
jgi:magnesium-transporting ATPase (P-type)